MSALPVMEKVSASLYDVRKKKDTKKTAFITKTDKVEATNLEHVLETDFHRQQAMCRIAYAMLLTSDPNDPTSETIAQLLAYHKNDANVWTSKSVEHSEVVFLLKKNAFYLFFILMC